jgi:hypothetical protein
MIKIEIPTLEIIYREVFVYKYLYIMMHEWLMEYGWKDESGDLSHKYIEEMYLERRLPLQGGIIEKEYRAWWRALKNLAGSSYYRWRMNIYMSLIYMRDVEIVHEGQKIKAQRGEITIRIDPVIEVDYQNKWEKHPILKHVHKFFINNIFNKELEGNKKGLYRDAYRFHGVIKNFLEQRYFVPEERLIHEKFEEI